MFDTEEEMDKKEKELVIVSEHTYNLCDGRPTVGFNYINKNGLTNTKLGRKNADIIIKEKYNIKSPGQLLKTKLINSHRFKKMWAEGKIIPYDWTGRKHLEETKQKISKANKGKLARRKESYVWNFLDY